MTPNMWIATFAWCCLMSGYLLRRRRQLHVPLVLTGIFFDFGLVIYLQFTREAVQKALGFSMPVLQQLHIGFSSLSLLLYVPTLILGIRLLTGNEAVRGQHRMFAQLALFFRTLGFLFMFSMWKSMAANTTLP